MNALKQTKNMRVHAYLALGTLALASGCLWQTAEPGEMDELESELAEEDLGDLDEEALGSIQQAVSNSQAIGVAPVNSGNGGFFGTTCPRESTSSSAPTAERVHIHMDDEDDNNNSKYTNGWEAPQTTVLSWWFTRGGSDTDLSFCRIDGSSFRAKTDNPASYTRFYSVLSLGAACPAGSSRVGIYIDNEDDNNNNYSSGSISPNSVGTNTYLYFCVFQADANATGTFPSLGAPYAVFHDWELSQPSWVLAKHAERSDNEDDNNKNAVIEGSSSAKTALSRMVELGRDTKFDFAQVK